MVTSFGFLATVVCPPFVREPGGWGLWAVVFIHKLSGHMKCVPGDSCQRPRRRPKLTPPHGRKHISGQFYYYRLVHDRLNVQRNHILIKNFIFIFFFLPKGDIDNSDSSICTCAGFEALMYWCTCRSDIKKRCLLWNAKLQEWFYFEGCTYDVTCTTPTPNN